MGTAGKSEPAGRRRTTPRGGLSPLVEALPDPGPRATYELDGAAGGRSHKVSIPLVERFHSVSHPTPA